MINIEHIFPVMRATAYIISGYFIARFASRLAGKYSALAKKVVFYIIFILFFISALHEFGFDLKVLLGATGILTVAIGFASQTSVSNFISGLFLLSENTLRVGDKISINNITGEILSVDLFSVKLRQSDNTLIRIPNEMVLKTQVVNLTHFPERRFECLFSIPGNTDITKLREIIFNFIKHEPLCLSIPSPLLEIKEIGDNNIKMQLYVWAKQEDFINMKYRVQEKLVRTLVENNISIADGTVNVKMV